MPASTPPALFGSIALGTGYLDDTHSEMHGRTLGIWQNVKAFGAVGDGLTDDTAAIVAMRAAHSRGPYYFPPGTYLTDPISLTGMQWSVWKGAGMENSIIKCRGSGAIFSVDSGLNHGNSFEDLQLEGTASSGQIGFKMNGANTLQCFFRRVQFKELQFAIDQDGDTSELTGNHFDRCEFNNAPIRMNGDGHNTEFFKMCRWSGHSQGVPACHIESTLAQVNIGFTDCVFEGNDREALRLWACRNVKIDNCYFEFNNLDDSANLPWINLGGSQNSETRIVGSYIYAATHANPAQVVIGSTAVSTDINALTLHNNDYSGTIDRAKMPKLHETQGGGSAIGGVAGPNTSIFTLGTGIGLKIGNGATILKHLSQDLANWNPGAINDGTFASNTFTVTGAAEGNTVLVTSKFNNWVQIPGVWISSWVSAADTITVVIHNESGGSHTPTNPTVLRADVWQH